MQTSTVFLVLVALCVFGFFAGRQRSQLVALAAAGNTGLHSLPKHYGYLVAAWAALPALLIFVLWLGFEQSLLFRVVSSTLPEAILSLPDSEMGLYYNQIVAFAQGAVDADHLQQGQVDAAVVYNSTVERFSYYKAASVLLVAVLAALIGLSRISPTLRARNQRPCTRLVLVTGHISTARSQ